jgi:gamma-glutamylcyclotransferase (GGCT)/AIG2-like uncharacterized protein YtfP
VLASLFAYGTLQPGRRRWPVLEPFATGHRTASVPGALFDSGYGWPVAVFDGSPAEVPGTLVELDRERLAEALALLDEVEASATDLLVRVVVTTTDGTPAWAYHCTRPTDGMTPIARWDSPEER